MATSLTNTEHVVKMKLEVSASWLWGAVSPSDDPNAKPFAPPGFNVKPTLYLPVKKRAGVAMFPPLSIHIELMESGKRRLNFRVPALTGAEVQVEVKNLFNAWDAGVKSTKLTGKLTAELTAVIEVPAKTVGTWLDPAGELKGRINENLLDFTVTVPSVKSDGKPTSGESQNRAYLYCRKAIAFLPGVFGSQFQVESSDGQIDAFPNFSSSSWWPHKQEIGLLECDSLGKPLLDAHKPGLLRIKGAVYDTYEKLHAARVLHLSRVPEAFLLFELNLFAYDWRGDLTEAAMAMMDRLRDLSKRLKLLPDTDDQIAVGGHSTGGVIMRRMLAEGDADSLISHAFFMNVPFRGAPKALSVMLTGCDPPGGDSMIPFITKQSLSNIALAAPIVYHLAPSYAYPFPVADYPPATGVGHSQRDIEKSALIDAAVKAGIYSARKVVSASRVTDKAQRQAIALEADKWAEYWDEYSLWQRARSMYEQFNPGRDNPFFKWPERELASRGLAAQSAARELTGWNVTLADNAFRFHKASEAAAATGKWAKKSYIFYSKIPSTTTGQVLLYKVSDTPSSVAELIQPGGTTRGVIDGKARPFEMVNANKSRDYDQWICLGDSYIKRKWRLSVRKVDGDGTVPLVSLLGFGGPAKVFKALPGNPEHVPAPNSEWLWQRVVEVLQGYNVDKHLNTAADPVAGTD